MLMNQHYILSKKTLNRSIQYNKSESESHTVVSNPLQPHGLYSPWNSPGRNTGVGSLSLLQGLFLTQGLNPGLPHCGQILYQLSHKGSPKNTGVGSLSFLQGIFLTQESNQGLLHCRRILYQLSYQRSPTQDHVSITWWKCSDQRLTGTNSVFPTEAMARNSLTQCLWLDGACMCVCILLCLTLWDPMDCSPAGSSVHRILQARILEWAVMPSSRDLPNPGIEPPPAAPALQVDSFTTEPPRKSPVEHDDYFINTKKRLWQPGTLGERVTRVTWTIPTTFLNVWDYFKLKFQHLFLFFFSLPSPYRRLPPSTPFSKVENILPAALESQLQNKSQELDPLGGSENLSCSPPSTHTTKRMKVKSKSSRTLYTAFTKAVS